MNFGTEVRREGGEGGRVGGRGVCMLRFRLFVLTLCVDGVRTLSMCLVIFGHAFIYALSSLHILNFGTEVRREGGEGGREKGGLSECSSVCLCVRAEF